MLNIEGEYRLEAKRDRIWPLIFDPSFLVLIIPGCRSLEEVNGGYYRGHIQIGIAGIGGMYETSVRVIETNPPEYCCFSGEVSGKSGLIIGEAKLNLIDLASKCQVLYQANGIITGALSKFDSRYFENIAQSFIHRGLSKLDRMSTSSGDFPPNESSINQRDGYEA